MTTTQDYTSAEFGDALAKISSLYYDDLRDMHQRKDEAYRERNLCVSLIARMALQLGLKVGIAKTDIEGWSDDWQNCVYIDLPTGQVSWHYNDIEAGLFVELPAYSGAWDGHDTTTKYHRVLSYPHRP